MSVGCSNADNVDEGVVFSSTKELFTQRSLPDKIVK